MLALFVSFVSSAFYLQHEEKSFLSWMRSTNQFYTGDEYRLRFGIFLTNSRYVKEFNTGHKNFRLSLNKFAACTPSEYKAYFGLRISRSKFFSVKSTLKTNTESLDWRDKGVVNEIKDQGECQSNYAFSLIQAIESRDAITTGTLRRFSEQNIVDCSSMTFGCNGGNPAFAFQSVIDEQNGQLCFEKDYIYTGNFGGDCKFAECPHYGSFLSATMVEEGDENDLAAKIEKYGPAYLIALGMMYLHSKNYIHRDLKPHGIYLDDYLLPKIGDFTTITRTDNKIKDIFVGTPLYMAPEVFKDETPTKAVDVYAFANIVYEIVTHKEPYDSGKKMDILRIYRNKMTGMRPKIDESVPEQYRKLIKSCWEEDPRKRPTFKEIVSMLKTDKSFITKKINEREFLKVVEEFDNMNHEYHDLYFDKVHIDYKEGKELHVDLVETNLKFYDLHEKVGEGQYGEVFQVIDIRKNSIYAAKVNRLHIEDCKYDQLKCLEREIKILSKLKSPLILKFIGFNRNDFDGEPRPTIITEFIKNMSLDKIIKLVNCGRKPKEWDDTKLLIVTYGIAAGMSHLHSLNILHRDLKPENVFLDEHLFPKIGDFGLSKEIEDDDRSNQSNSFVGTPAFMAPEIFEGLKYTKAGDVYAFGILLYEITTFDLPYKEYNAYNLSYFVVNGVRPKFNVDIPKCYKFLIEKCWHKEPKKRPTFSEIVNYLKNDEEFITDDVDEDQFLEYVKFVDDNVLDDSFKEVTLDFEELKRIQENDPLLNVPYIDINLYEKQQLIKTIDNFDICVVRNIETNAHYEAKISTIQLTKLSRSEIIHLSREVNILSKMIHPVLLKFIGYSPIDFNLHPFPVLINEMPPRKSLEYHLNLKRKGKLEEEKDDDENEEEETMNLIFIYGIANGMEFLHSHGILHRNLCPENIFLTQDLCPKIGNFGLLTKIHSIKSMTYQSTVGIKGNPSYSSPELIESGTYSETSDVYAFAMIVYELVTLNVPFKDIKNINSLYKEVVTLGRRPKIDNLGIPQFYVNLIESCWSQNPNERPTFKEIVSSLEKYAGFITRKIHKRTFKMYVNFLKNSSKKFNSKNRVVCYDDMIIEKRKDKDDIDESQSSDSECRNSSKEKTRNKDDDIEPTSFYKSKKKKEKKSTSKISSENEREKKSTSKISSENKREKKSTSKISSENKKEEKSTSKISSENEREKKSTSKISSENKKEEKSASKISSENRREEKSASIISSENKKTDKKSKSKNKRKSKNDDDDDFTPIDMPEIKDTYEPLISKLLNRECIDSINADFLKYLLNTSKQLSTSSIFTTFKKKFGEIRGDEDFLLIKVFTEKSNVSSFKEKQKELKKKQKFIIKYKAINELYHPNIGKALGFYNGNNKQQPAILFEFYSNSLKDVIQSLDDSYLVSIIYEICHAMMTAHLEDIIHRDLNPENIFVNFENHAKIMNFTSTYIMTQKEQIKLDYDVFCLSKEFLENNEFTEKVDVFAFGVIMFYILTRGKGPFLSREDILEGKKPKIPKYINRISFSIISQCLSHSQEQRPSFKQLKNFIVKNNFKLIDGIENKINFIKDHLRSNQ